MSFYKTYEEKLLAKAIDEIFKDTIGGAENHYEDTGELTIWTEDELVDEITDGITKSTTPLYIEDSLQALEPKHIRFIGKDRVREIVKRRVGLWLDMQPSICVTR